MERLKSGRTLIPAMCHSQYYKVVDEAKKNNIPIRYFSFASPYKCAEQFVQEDKKASK